MSASSVAYIFSRIQMPKSNNAVLRAILSKTNIYGMHAKVSVVTLMAISGYCERTVQYATKDLEARGLLRIERQVIRFAYNDINVYHVVVPWRFDALAHPTAKPYWTRPKKRGASAVHPNPEGREKPPARLCSEEEAGRYWTPYTVPWYACQGLKSPREEKGDVE